MFTQHAKHLKFETVGFDTSCKLSPAETVCIECQCLFSEKNKKKRMLSAEIFTQQLSINPSPAELGYVMPLQTV